jgi:ubiquinone/menaquinone biosynthesis C-methylase UbiE
MQEWLQSTLQRILRLNPQKLLEIGCGVGLLVQHLAPRCAAYVGTDFSAAALTRLQCWLTDKDLGHVELLHRSATELQDIEPGRFDTVVLNSVVQYFPDVDYLLAVLQQAVRLVGPDGRIFIGDVRHFGLLRMFHSAVQLSRAADPVTVEQLRRYIMRALTQETELAIDPEFFHALVGRLPGIISADVQLKGGTASNELTRYRYDVVLHVGGQRPDRIACDRVTWGRGISSMTELEAALRERRWPAARIDAIPNLRLAAECVTQRLIDTSDERLTAGALRHQLSEVQSEAIDPERLRSLVELHGYDVSIEWCSENSPACFAARLLDPERRGREHEVTHRLPDVAKPWDSYANCPRENRLRQQLIPQLRAFLKERLPEHLIPSDWTVLKEQPLVEWQGWSAGEDAFQRSARVV